METLSSWLLMVFLFFHLETGEDYNNAQIYYQYEIIKKIGEGGFGRVYLASHKETEQLKAIKLIDISNYS
jgi:serine/threonine protein kinase